MEKQSIPNNVAARFEIFKGFGMKELMYICAAIGIGVALFFLLGAPKNKAVADTNATAQVEQPDPSATPDATQNKNPFAFLPGNDPTVSPDASPSPAATKGWWEVDEVMDNGYEGDAPHDPLAATPLPTLKPTPTVPYVGYTPQPGQRTATPPEAYPGQGVPVQTTNAYTYRAPQNTYAPQNTQPSSGYSVPAQNSPSRLSSPRPATAGGMLRVKKATLNQQRFAGITYEAYLNDGQSSATPVFSVTTNDQGVAESGVGQLLAGRRYILLERNAPDLLAPVSPITFDTPSILNGFLFTVEVPASARDAVPNTTASPKTASPIPSPTSSPIRTDIPATAAPSASLLVSDDDERNLRRVTLQSPFAELVTLSGSITVPQNRFSGFPVVTLYASNALCVDVSSIVVTVNGTDVNRSVSIDAQTGSVSITPEIPASQLSLAKVCFFVRASLSASMTFNELTPYFENGIPAIFTLAFEQTAVMESNTVAVVLSPSAQHRASAWTLTPLIASVNPEFSGLALIGAQPLSFHTAQTPKSATPAPAPVTNARAGKSAHSDSKIPVSVRIWFLLVPPIATLIFLLPVGDGHSLYETVRGALLFLRRQKGYFYELGSASGGEKS